MKKYEITFILGESLTEDKAKEVAREIKKIFEKHGARIEKEFFWGKRKLTYKIAKNTFGYYFILVFDLEPKETNLINEELRLNEKVIRYLMVDFIENSPFFELEGEKGKKTAKDDGEDTKTPVRRAKKQVVEEKIEEAPEEVLPEPEAKVEEKAVEPEIEEVPAPEKEKVAEPEVEAVEEEKVEEPAPKEDVKADEKEEIERKPERRRMTEDERKEQLEKKLAELLKDEDEIL